MLSQYIFDTSLVSNFEEITQKSVPLTNSIEAWYFKAGLISTALENFKGLQKAEKKPSLTT